MKKDKYFLSAFLIFGILSYFSKLNIFAFLCFSSLLMEIGYIWIKAW